MYKFSFIKNKKVLIIKLSKEGEKVLVYNIKIIFVCSMFNYIINKHELEAVSDHNKFKLSSNINGIFCNCK